MRQLLHLYQFTYYWQRGGEREQLLSELKPIVMQAQPEAWAGLPVDTLADTLRISDPELQAAVRAHLPTQTVLTDKDGKPVLRYLGYTVAPGKSPVDEDPALHFRLFFEVLAEPQKDFSAWFHIVRNTDDEQWMIYDYFPDKPTSQWQEASIYVMDAYLALEPGNHDISFGFWTPNFRERLYVDHGDAYWINLGTHEMDGSKSEQP